MWSNLSCIVGNFLIPSVINELKSKDLISLREEKLEQDIQNYSSLFQDDGDEKYDSLTIDFIDSKIVNQE